MKKDGGPAFPHDAMQLQMGCAGMSLRDYFAAAALPECLSFWRSQDGFFQKAITYAQLAYDAADAMLAERDK